MAEQPEHNDSSWSSDTRWALAMSESAVLLLDASGKLEHANTAATALAKRLQAFTGMTSPVSLLGRMPAESWEMARRHGRWSGQLQAGPDEPAIGVRLFCDLPGGGRTMAVFDDLTERSAHEIELQKRHDELQRVCQRLAGTQEQLLRSEKMASIGQLAAGVAHEINNPIGYVHSNLGTLQDYASALFSLIDNYAGAMQDDDPAAHRQALAATRERLDIDFITGDLPQLLKESTEGVERMIRIVRDLKDFSRIDYDTPMRPSDLTQGLESTLNIVWNDLKYKVNVEKYYSPLPLVECHPSQINQVLMNLLINAGQAIGERGTITLATGAHGGYAWVSISDTGCGIAEEAVGRIFDPFYTTKAIGTGTGLGLPICHGIVAKHSGRIEVSSQVGKGSTFRVVLPLVQPDPAGGSQAGVEPGSGVHVTDPAPRAAAQ